MNNNTTLGLALQNNSNHSEPQWSFLDDLNLILMPIILANENNRNITDVQQV